MAAESQVTLATLIATQIHSQQKDAQGMDYILHPMAVAVRAVELGYPEHMIAAALLHDVMEDSDITADELRHLGVNDRTIRIVKLLTRQNSGKPDEEPYQDFIYRICSSYDAARVKLLDVEHNLGRIFGIKDADKRDRLMKKYVLAQMTLKNAMARLAGTPEPRD